MVSPTPLLMAVTTLLLTIFRPVSAIPEKHPTRPIDGLTSLDKYRKFNIAIRRYRDNYCTHPSGSPGDFGVHPGPRTYIAEPKPKHAEDECHSWIDGDSFGSYDFEWEPRKGYEGQRGHDDPALGPKGMLKFCRITVFESDDCGGKEVGVLTEANRWENIGACHGDFEVEGRSLTVQCAEL